MSSGDNGNHSSERQPLHKDIQDEPDFANDLNVHNGAMSVDHSVTSLIEQRPAPGLVPDDTPSFSIEPVFQNTMDNPYRETTVSVPHLVRRLPSSDLLPRPWKHLQWILIASYVSMLFCFLTGIAANHYAWKAKKHQSKGLYGLVQRDSKFAVVLIYSSIGLGIVLIIIISVAVRCSEGC